MKCRFFGRNGIFYIREFCFWTYPHVTHFMSCKRKWKERGRRDDSFFFFFLDIRWEKRKLIRSVYISGSYLYIHGIRYRSESNKNLPTRARIIIIRARVTGRQLKITFPLCITYPRFANEKQKHWTTSRKTKIPAANPFVTYNNVIKLYSLRAIKHFTAARGRASTLPYTSGIQTSPFFSYTYYIPILRVS